MNDEFIFSWAENTNGEMVHVDSVPKGTACNCFCPHCKEPLIARNKGEIRKHGFAHHSENRQSNLKICYEVVRYKLAEHIIQTKKKIHVPSYYGIFKATDIDFVDVKIDNRYEREDKQPDVIATTKEGLQYLIEFTFEHKVQHKKDIDYNNLTCLEIDLSRQTLDTLEGFLMNSEENKTWVNNEIYFSQIEDVYRKANKAITLVDESSCLSCEIKDICCAIKQRGYPQMPIRISHNGQIYRMCKNDDYECQLQLYREEQLRREEEKKRLELEWYNRIQIQKNTDDFSNMSPSTPCESRVKQNINLSQTSIEEDNIQERSCFACIYILPWGNRNRMAKCGKLQIAKLVNPDFAKTCKYYKKK